MRDEGKGYLRISNFIWRIVKQMSVLETFLAFPFGTTRICKILFILKIRQNSMLCVNSTQIPNKFYEFYKLSNF